MNRPGEARYAIVLTAILLVGVTLRTIEYAALGSLWVDELFIALNVTTKSLGELLTSPLAFHQVAPIGFLAAEKVSTLLFGVNEAALRLFPYLASLASLALFWRVASRFLTEVPRLGAIAIFAMSPAMLWFARNAKQYSSDVAVTLLILLLALRFREARPGSRPSVSLAVIGGIAILFSQPAVIVGATVLAVLVVQQKRSGEGMRPLAAIVAAWGIGMAVVAVTSLILSPLETREFMSEGWSGRGFVPLGPEAFIWIPHRLLLILGLFVAQFAANRWEELTVAGIFGILALIGWPYLARRMPTRTVLLSSVVGGAILAAAAGILPLSRRVSIYTAPTLLIVAMAGMDQIRAWLPKGARVCVHAGVLGLVAIPAMALFLFVEFPNRREDSKPVLVELRRNLERGDVIYALPATQRALEFYGPALGIDHWYAGAASRHEVRHYLADLDSLRGNRRVWFFYSHVAPCHQLLIRSYLETIGREIMRIEDPHGNKGKSESAAYLYDLSDPARLDRSNARVFPVPDRMPAQCGYPEKAPWTRAKDRLRTLGSILEG